MLYQNHYDITENYDIVHDYYDNIIYDITAIAISYTCDITYNYDIIDLYLTYSVTYDGGMSLPSPPRQGPAFRPGIIALQHDSVLLL